MRRGWAAIVLAAAGCCRAPDLGAAKTSLSASWGDGGVPWGGGSLAAPAPLDFGSVAVGTTATRAVLLVNQSNAAVELRSADFLDGGSPAFDESQAVNSIAGGGSAPVQVVFAPQSVGPAAAELEIRSDATAGSIIDVPVRGIGTSGVRLALRIASVPDGGTVGFAGPLSADLGETYLGSTGAAWIEVIDTGTQGVTLAPIALSRGSSPELSVAEPPSLAVAPDGGLLSFQVRFAPTDAGGAQGSLFLTSADGAADAGPVLVRGECDPRIRVCARGCGPPPPWPVLSFGTMSAGSEEVQAIEVENVGWAPLHFDARLAPGTAPAFSIDDADGGPLEATLPASPPGTDAGSSTDVPVALAAQQVYSFAQVMSYAGWVQFGTDDPTLDGGPAFVYLDGECDDCAVPPPEMDAGCFAAVGSQGCTTELDTFEDGGLSGWTFAGQASPTPGCGGSCTSGIGACNCADRKSNTGYSLSVDPAQGAAEISGDICSSGQQSPAYGIASGGMAKTFSIVPGRLRIEFNWRASSCWNQSSTTTNAGVAVVDPGTGNVIWSDSLSRGGTYDTGWQHYRADLSCFVTGLSKVVVVLYLGDGWDADWEQADWFDRIEVTTCAG